MFFAMKFQHCFFMKVIYSWNVDGTGEGFEAVDDRQDLVVDIFAHFSDAYAAVSGQLRTFIFSLHFLIELHARTQIRKFYLYSVAPEEKRRLPLFAFI